MTKDAVKNKAICKKSSVSSSMDFEVCIKNQQNLICQLETDLKEAISKKQLLEYEVGEKNKLINELEESITQKIEEVNRINTSLEETEEENKNILIEFNCFKEKFYQLETDYDKSLQELKDTNLQLIEDLEKQNVEKDHDIQTLSSNCCELELKLQKSAQEFDQLKKLHLETINNFEVMKKDLESQSDEFELYKKRVNENNINETKFKQEIDQLKEELARKDALIKQCTIDKDLMEKEKNLTIDELNNKIYRIERAFNQPTKVVQPISANVNQLSVLKNNSGHEKFSENINVTTPLVQKSLDDMPLNNLVDIENKKSESILPQRNYKFKRPMLTASPQKTNRKRRNQPVRQSTIINNISSSSSSSSSAGEDDDSNFNDSCLQHLWRPSKHNDECYVADTDTSEGFAKSKRSRK